MRIKKVYIHLAYWLVIVIILTIIFGISWDNKTNAIYFISLLLPVIMATSYFFNYFLVPKYLLQSHYFKFILYTIYTIIISLFLEMAVFIFTFSFLLEYDVGAMNHNAFNTLLLGVVMYLVVFFTSLVLMIRQLIDNKMIVVQLEESLNKLNQQHIQVISNRKSVQITYKDIKYIESYSDSIKIMLESGKEIKSKERLSSIEKKLPISFIRIHRSFIINSIFVSRFNYNEVEINETTFQIGRTYKNHVSKILKVGNKHAR